MINIKYNFRKIWVKVKIKSYYYSKIRKSTLRSSRTKTMRMPENKNETKAPVKLIKIIIEIDNYRKWSQGKYRKWKQRN